MFSGFIVVAACVMTFEARDRAAKFMSNQLKIMGGGGTISSHRGHGRQTPSGGDYLSRGDSGRSSYQNPGDAARNKMNKSPSAPNLAAAAAAGRGRVPFRHKHAVHVLSPGGGGGGGGGRALLSPLALRRQAMSMDTQDYNPFFSPPRSRHSSSGLLTCAGGGGNNSGNVGAGGSKPGGGGGGGSRESVNDPRARGSRGSMVLDLHVPNECPVTMRVRDRSRRSDTARRHMLCRQTPVELDDAAIVAYAAADMHGRQRAKRCTRSATCDVPHAAGRPKRRRQDSSCSDVVAARRRSGSPGCGGRTAGCGWRSSANDVVDAAEWARTAGGGGSAASTLQRVAAAAADARCRSPVRGQPGGPTAQNTVDSKMSLSRTCSDIVSIDNSFEESNYSSS